MDRSLGFFEKDRPCFVEVIGKSTIRREKLKLPKKFVERYSNNMPSNVTLKIPNGSKWQVELLKKNTEIWFEKGWKEFAENLCLKPGQAIFFQYCLASHFHVIIFDASGLEIEYPDNNMEVDGDYLQYLNALISADKHEEDDY